MRHDPARTIAATTMKRPPPSGPGSGKDAWKAYADMVVDANHSLQDVIGRQSATIRELQAEIALLRQEAAARKPHGGRERLKDEKVARIEQAISEKTSTRHIASLYGVSAMTVSRIGKRMRDRATASVLAK